MAQVEGETISATFPLVQALGLIGKAPSRAELIHLNRGDPLAEALIRWLEEGQHGLNRADASLTSAPTCFLYCSPTVRRAAIGALVPSRDKNGRPFPLTAFAALAATEVGENFPLFPSAFDSFLRSAAALLKEAHSLAADQLHEKLRLLPLPGNAEWQTAQNQRAFLLEQPSARWTRRLMDFGGGFGPHYAFRTFLKACKQRAYQNGQTRITLVCPLDEQGPLPWLELASRMLSWKSQPPSFLWSEAVPARLLLSLGPGAPAGLTYLGRPDTSTPNFWSLKTEHVSAMVAARQALSLKQCRAIEDGDASIDRLLSCLIESSQSQ